VRSNVVARLAPGGPIARVGGLTAEVRDVREHFARELVLTRHLAAAGAPAVRPHEPAGPHEHAGHVVTLWQAAGDGPAPPGDQAGRALRACHEALRTLPRAATSGLPGVTELLGEALGLVDAIAGLPRGDRLLLRGHLLRATAEVLGGRAARPGAARRRRPGQRPRRPGVERLGGLLLGPRRLGSRVHGVLAAGARHRTRPRRGGARRLRPVPGRRRPRRLRPRPCGPDGRVVGVHRRSRRRRPRLPGADGGPAGLVREQA
jgi:hypothetical protein